MASLNACQTAGSTHCPYYRFELIKTPYESYDKVHLEDSGRWVINSSDLISIHTWSMLIDTSHIVTPAAKYLRFKHRTEMVTGQLPLGQLPPGQLPWGQLPRGQLPRRTTTPIGQLPRGQLPPGQLPLRTITPVGQLPRGQLPLLVGQLPLRTITPLILICG